MFSDTGPVVFVGAATLDAVAVAPRYPGPDDRQVADRLELAGGGPAATAAVACARLGIRTALVGCVGDDPEGERIRTDLAAEGVDVTALRHMPNARSGMSVVVVAREQGTRAISTRPMAPLQLDRTAWALVDAASWVHVDHLGWPAVVRRHPNRRPFQLSVDAGNPSPGTSHADVDLYVPTLAALRREHGEVPVDRLLARVLESGVHAVVATMGPDGCVGARATGERASAPALPVEVVSTLGAGDVFHGALLAAIIRGLTFKDCLAYASAAAGLSCRALDGRSAIPTHAEVASTLAGWTQRVSA